MKKTGLYSFWRVLRESTKKRNIKRELHFGDVRLVDKNGDKYCPLTYVDHALNGSNLDTCEWEKAAINLGIDSEYAGKIVDAADSNMNDERKLRAKLMKTLKLKEPKTS